MDNYQLQEKKFSIWKRIFIFLLDGLMSFIVFVLLFNTIGTFLLKQICHNDIDILNTKYQNVCETNNYPYTIDKQFNLYIFDNAAYIDIKINDGLTVEDAYEESEKKDQEITEILSKDPEYVKSYKKFYSNYKIMIVFDMFIPLLIFQLIIPLFTKKRQTLSMIIFKGTMVRKNDNVLISKNFLLLRFFFIFIVEFLIIYLLLSAIGTIFTVLITLIVICFTKNRLTLHDAILKLKITNPDQAFNQ